MSTWKLVRAYIYKWSQKRRSKESREGQRYESYGEAHRELAFPTVNLGQTERCLVVFQSGPPLVWHMAHLTLEQVKTILVVKLFSLRTTYGSLNSGQIGRKKLIVSLLIERKPLYINPYMYPFPLKYIVLATFFESRLSKLAGNSKVTKVVYKIGPHRGTLREAFLKFFSQRKTTRARKDRM